MKGDFLLGLTFDDVLLIPKRSSLKSRWDVDITTRFSRNIKLNIPLVSSPMDTVTEDKMAITLARHGGIGVIHRYLTLDKQVEKLYSIHRLIQNVQLLYQSYLLDIQ